METRRKSISPVHSENDHIDVEEFARQFFATDVDYERISPAKTIQVQQRKHRQRPKHKKKQGRELAPDSLDELSTSTARGSNSNLKNNSAKFQKQPLDAKKYSEYIQMIPADFKKSVLLRFLELQDEFFSLSERLERVNMQEVSKRLTKVLAERQRLMAMLLEMGKPAQQNPSVLLKDHKQKDFGMLKKTKNVHWSDDYLGGSIVQDSAASINDLSDHEPTFEASKRHTKRSVHYRRHEDFKILPNPTQTSRQQPKESVYHSRMEISTPCYEMVDNSTQTNHRLRSQTESQCDIQGNLCSFGVGYAVGCVEDIVSEAAALRREACNMLWRAYYLEQLCDPNGIVKHVFYSPSYLPELPRYPHLY